MEEQKNCETCQHFLQHYVKHSRGYTPTNVGHCVNPRCRDKKPATPACHRYLEKRK